MPRLLRLIRRQRKTLLVLTIMSIVVFVALHTWTESSETLERKDPRLLSVLLHWLVKPTPRYHVTLVTAFLDIGEFAKTRPERKRDHRLYETWSSAYFRVLSPVVLYTDSESFARHFLSVRRKLLNVTKVVMVRRDGLWSFGLKDRIAAVYSRRDYPKNYPNTVYPEYTCLTHAKMDFLQDAVDNADFPSRLVAWMDVGYLRDIAGKNFTGYYNLLPPLNLPLDASRVLCGQVVKPNFTTPWLTVIRRNRNWVAGGFFLATPDVMTRFVTQYRRAVTSFLALNESQVEQQVIYAMYTNDGRRMVKPIVELQAVPGGWFTIGFRCLRPSNMTLLLT
ncbi:uncharacterized protein [Littorina saxatilis]|uniref:uncharacterized protein n=1 Tax=Littorina saxatilis TaxID=31220 RepID=UPI0038B45085